MTPPEQQPRSRWVVSPAWCGLIGILLHVQTLSFGLVNYDDAWLVQGNTALQDLSWPGVRRIWLDLSPETRLRLGAEYLPVRDMIMALDFALHGQDYSRFHLTNILLYGLACALFALMIRRWTGRLDLAWIAGLIFAVHPIHAEAVAWISGRKELLLISALSGAALCHHAFLRRPTLLRWLATALCLVLAVWSKAVGVTGVGLLVGLTWFLPPQGGTAQGGARPRTAWLALAGLLLSGLAAFVPVWRVGSSLMVETRPLDDSLLANLALAAKVHALYLYHLLPGVPLGIGYQVPPAGQGGALVLFGVAAALGLVALAALGAIRRGPLAITGLSAALWLLFYLPVSHLLVTIQTVMADRYLTLPSMAAALLAAAALTRLSSRPLQRMVLVLFCLVAAGASLVQARTWSSSRALYERALELHPDAPDVHIQLAQLDSERGRHDLAHKRLAMARQANPRHSGLLMHQGLLLVKLGRLEQAVTIMRQAANLDQTGDKVRANLALLLVRQGKVDQAVSWAVRAVKVREMVPHNQRTLGVAALAAGRLPLAEQAFQRAHQLQPDHPDNLYNLAAVAHRKGDLQAAATWARRALKLRPDHAGARGLLRALESR